MTTTIIAAFNDGRLPATFWNKVTVSRDACWLWTGCCNTKGYGRFSWQQSPFIQRDWLAHRASWVHLVGPVPNGLELDHLCRNRRCVNPRHLEAVTHSENLDRAIGMGVASAAQHRAKTRCPQGHEYTDANTLYVTARRWRQCRACNRERARARRAVTR